MMTKAIIQCVDKDELVEILWVFCVLFRYIYLYESGCHLPILEYESKLSNIQMDAKVNL